MAGVADLGQPKFVGASVRHVEDPKFLTGNGRYVDDFKLPGMLHAAFARSTHAHALIKSVDVERARQVPGVVAVFTAEDIEGEGKPINASCIYDTYQETPQELLVKEKVRFVGEPIAVVVAEDRYAAEDGLDQIEIEYEPLEPVMNVEQALADGAPVLHDTAPDNLHVWFHRHTGDVDKAFEEADFTVELELKTQRYAAVCLETRGAIARYDESVNELTVWISSQTPHLFRTAFGEFLDIPQHQIRVIAPYLGGGFGQKTLLHPDEVMVPLLARKLRRPVKWISDRREDLLVSMHAREQLHRLKAAVRNDGRVLGIRAEIYADNGAYSCWPVTAALDMGQAADNVTGPYEIPNYDRRVHAVITNKAPMGPYRGVGRPHGCMDHERLMDEIARKLDKDPAEVRLLNFIKEFPHVTASQFHIESGDYVQTLEHGLEKFGYEQKKREHAELAKQGIYRGIGIAFNVEQSAHGKSEWERKGVKVAAGYDTAEMRVEPDGKVRLAVGLHNHGQGQETTMAQIAADQLGMEIADINVVFGDTAQVPYGFGSYSSRATVYCGGATILAAKEIREKAMKLAAHMMEANVDDVELADGRFAVRGNPSQSVTWAEVSQIANHRAAKLPPGMEPGLDALSKYMAAEWGSFANAVHVVETEVDPETGRVEILDYTIVEDCGTVVNPKGCEGQIHGGIAQGIGGLFLEDMHYDEAGQMIAGTFMDYLLPGFCEVPEVEIYHLETPSPINVGGFKGMGEGGCINVAPAIANSIIDAVKPLATISLNDTPILPQTILEAMRATGAATSG
ncbi:MAG: aerobic carbon-monoxide dehydrogenase large subunit [Thermoleophilaceae bacterium]|nr:aerobic carbon-monoxide dehydrogenase large subunit [Thermoleophilaceae bacterium]